MKKLYIISAFLLLASLSKATVHVIQALSTSFSPSAQAATCGDTIVWVLTNPSEVHTTTSTSVPSGAAGWGANLSSSSPTYSYVITTAGTYSYQCNFHVSMGMKGTLTVTCPNGVPSISNYYLSSAYPNPFANRLTIEFADADLISIYNAVGEKIRTIAVRGQIKAEINAAELHDGIYFYCLIKDGIVIETRKVVKN